MNKEQILDNVLDTVMHKINYGLNAIYELPEDDPKTERYVENVLVLFPVAYELRSLILQTHDEDRIWDWSNLCHLYAGAMDNLKDTLSFGNRRACIKIIKLAKEAEIEADRAIEILEKAKDE